MIKPTDFCFNEETASDNEFQNTTGESQAEVLKQAIKEFDQCVKILKDNDFEVIILDKTEVKSLEKIKLPDAVFPN